MPLYDAAQVVGKTLVLKKNINYYKVIDINNLGDKATKAGTLKAGTSIIVDSYLAPTPSFTSQYGIKYAQRTRPYFTFFLGDVYAACVIGDGFFDIDILQAQGAQTVQQQQQAAQSDEYYAEHPFAKFMHDLGLDGLGKNFKTIIIIAAIILLSVYLLPIVMQGVKKAKLAN